MKKERIIALTLTAMRLTFLYAFLTTVVGLSAYATGADAQGTLNKKITFSAQQVSIKNMISAIERQSKVRFIYSSSTIRANRKVSVRQVDRELASVLEDVFAPLGIGYKVEKDKVLLYSMAQEFTITGVVTNSEDGTAILGAAIRAKGSVRGTSTDELGR